ncbi:MAG: 6-bladed beta-propeller, partial [Longimicrobiales bacterium]
MTRISLLSASMLLCTACAASDQAQSPDILLNFRDEIPHGLEATDTALLRPFEFTLGASELYVADEANPDVRTLDERGQLLRVLGKKGDGPGEFRRLSGLALASDGGLAVADSRTRRITFFDAAGNVTKVIPIARGR